MGSNTGRLSVIATAMLQQEGDRRQSVISNMESDRIEATGCILADAS
jgi:hypothetical protein